MIKQETHGVATVKETLTHVVNWLKWQVMAINPFACGYTNIGNIPYHDHSYDDRFGITVEGPYVQNGDHYTREPYNETKHGEVKKFLKEGDPIPGLACSIHTHSEPKSGQAGSWEFTIKE